MSGLQIRKPRALQQALLPEGSRERGWMVAVEGPIGVGKTTLARRLAARFGAELLLEVVEENPFLSTFYQDVRGRAFQTQLFFLLSRHRQHRAVYARLAAGRGIIADYIFAKDRLFAGLTLDAAELALYDAVYHLIAPQVPRPAAVIYLKATLETLLRHIAARKRPFERDLTPAYLIRLSAAYDAFLADFEDAPVITVDTDRFDLQDDAGVAAIADAVGSARRGELRVTAPASPASEGGSAGEGRPPA